MDDPQSLDWRRDRLALGFAFLAFVLHAAFAGRYDLFRDELYFIVCGRHPAFGYADQPPVVPLLAAGFYALGHSVWMVRLPACLAAAAVAWLSVRFVRLAGGGTVAAVGAALCVSIAPMLMGILAVFNTTVFEPFIWTLIAFCLVKAVLTGDRRALWLCGLAAGIDLEIKYALVFWCFSLAVGLAATPERKLLLRKDLWIGVAIAAVIAMPSLVWQALHGFPFLELAAAAKYKNADTPPVAFLLNQVLVMGPLLAPVWLAGLAAPFAVARLKPLRFVAIGFVVCVALVMLTHGKDYYLAACYPVLFVVGAVAIAHWVTSLAGRIALAGWAAAAVAFSAWIAPLALPILPVPQLKAFVQHFPLKPQQQEKSFAGTLLPQVFADQLGWRDFTAEVGAAWAKIPAAERARTSIKVENYGEAAALDVYGASYGLPPALSGHNQYYLWGPRGQNPVNVLVVQNHFERLVPYCRQASVLATTFSPDAMAYENGKVIAYCQGLKMNIHTLWPELKNFS
jgi:4-amino-4-deoxy-L-arabinose transferase-like glycosyltransferase